MVQGVGSTKRTSKVASDGFMFLAFKVCWDQIFRQSEELLRRHHRNLLSTLAGMYFFNDVRIKQCIIHYEHTFEEAICDISYEESPPFQGHLRRG